MQQQREEEKTKGARPLTSSPRSKQGSFGILGSVTTEHGSGTDKKRRKEVRKADLIKPLPRFASGTKNLSSEVDILI